MSHWQTGKLDLKCSLNILKKALCNMQPEWADHIQVDESCNLKVTYEGGRNVNQRYQMVVKGDKTGLTSLKSDVGLARNSDGTWEIGGDSGIGTLKLKLTGEVARMKAIAIAKMRGYEVIKNLTTDEEIITEIRVDAEKARELL